METLYKVCKFKNIDEIYSSNVYFEPYRINYNKFNESIYPSRPDTYGIFCFKNIIDAKDYILENFERRNTFAHQPYENFYQFRNMTSNKIWNYIIFKVISKHADITSNICALCKKNFERLYLLNDIKYVRFISSSHIVCKSIIIPSDLNKDLIDIITTKSNKELFRQSYYKI